VLLDAVTQLSTGVVLQVFGKFCVTTNTAVGERWR